MKSELFNQRKSLLAHMHFFTNKIFRLLTFIHVLDTAQNFMSYRKTVGLQSELTSNRGQHGPHKPDVTNQNFSLIGCMCDRWHRITHTVQMTSVSVPGRALNMTYYSNHTIEKGFAIASGWLHRNDSRVASHRTLPGCLLPKEMQWP